MLELPQGDDLPVGEEGRHLFAGSRIVMSFLAGTFSASHRTFLYLEFFDCYPVFFQSITKLPGGNV
ncbi:hypothetical protein kam1_450 [Methylacidiphilum kamchatkense Kam1]|uniref:Uncharacterized protein n=1 Tax=Methylacidiphilum kamchatkense Kam1 TaxID=1202785 RepID=A0A516TKC3_9BACT|nr:hypothetical protein kam1_450 [Methylacidiphilum kamchatkense Kam1]